MFLTPDERRELERYLKFRERCILTDGEVAASLARIAGRDKLDAVLAEIPPALVGPLQKYVEAPPALQPYCPASLPPVTSLDAVVLDSGAAVSCVRDFIRVAALRYVSLTGEAARAIASLWRKLPPGEQARCHIPPYGLRFHSASGSVCEASICWQCNNIYGQAGSEEFDFEFDAQAAISRQLLAAIRQAVGDQPGGRN